MEKHVVVGQLRTVYVAVCGPERRKIGRGNVMARWRAG